MKEGRKGRWREGRVDGRVDRRKEGGEGGREEGREGEMRIETIGQRQTCEGHNNGKCLGVHSMKCVFVHTMKSLSSLLHTMKHITSYYELRSYYEDDSAS
jgi:hypothetical protein